MHAYLHALWREQFIWKWLFSDYNGWRIVSNEQSTLTWSRFRDVNSLEPLPLTIFIGMTETDSCIAEPYLESLDLVYFTEESGKEMFLT